MKIALYVAELDIKGGTHKQVLRLAEYLVSAGHEVSVWTPLYDLKRTYAGFAAVEVHTLSGAKPGRVLPYFRLALMLPRFDVIHIHDNRGVIFFVVAKLFLRARVFVWQINDLHPSFGLGNSAALTQRRRSVVHRTVNRLMGRAVDAVTVNVSKNVRRVADLLQVPAHLFYCGVDLPEREPASAEGADCVSDYPSRRTFQLLSTGAFVGYRNYETLIESVYEAKIRLGSDIAVTIVGDTRYDAPYVQRIRLLASERSVKLSIRENLSEEELGQQIDACDVFVFINVDQSWGLAVFEAAAACRPVVLSKSVGAAELLSGKPGFLTVDPLSTAEVSAAIESLLTAGAARRALGRRARAAVEEMTWPATYGEPVANLFRNLLAR